MQDRIRTNDCGNNPNKGRRKAADILQREITSLKLAGNTLWVLTAILLTVGALTFFSVQSPEDSLVRYSYISLTLSCISAIIRMMIGLRIRQDELTKKGLLSGILPKEPKTKALVRAIYKA